MLVWLERLKVSLSLVGGVLKLPVSQLKAQDLADLFEKSFLRDQYFFPRKVPSLFPLAEEKTQLRKQDLDRNQNEESMEKS